MDIFVCIKQVPHPDHFSKITLDPETKTIRREGVPVVINPADKHAIEQALRIREERSGKVTVLTMGPPQARKALEEALAMGADEAFLLCDRLFAAADTLATASTLASGIRTMGHFDLILCGDKTVDSGAAQVGPQLAQLLGLPCATNIDTIRFEDEKNLVVRQAIERGHVTSEIPLPALLSVTRQINKPRLASAFGILAVADKEIRELCCPDIGADPNMVGLKGSPTAVVDTVERRTGRKAEILTGPPEETVRQALRKIQQLGGADLLP
ncbi:MAG: electron transfer flavoprotein subunit beta/FixA family protein [Chloroflexota bacterium]